MLRTAHQAVSQVEAEQALAGPNLAPAQRQQEPMLETFSLRGAQVVELLSFLHLWYSSKTKQRIPA